MNEIKNYKPLALVFYIDGNGNRCALPLDNSRVQEFKQAIQNQKMVELEWIVINSFEVKEIRPAEKTSELEKYYYSRSYQERSFIASRVRSRAGNQKVNVLESLAELGTEKAINLMQRWIDSVHEYKEPTTTQKTTTTQPITAEEKEQLKAKFKSILSKYELKWKN